MLSIVPASQDALSKWYLLLLLLLLPSMLLKGVWLRASHFTSLCNSSSPAKWVYCLLEGIV